MKTQLRDIEYFAVLAEHRHIGRAAEVLGLSQPALSKSLRRLESSMQAKLAKRTPKGIELTMTGSALLAQVRRLRLSLKDVTREITDLSQGRAGHLRIGTATGFVVQLIPEACGVLLKEAPGVTISVTVAASDQLLQALRNGDLDLVIAALSKTGYENVVQEHFSDDEFVVYCSPGHRLAGKKRVTLADIAREEWSIASSKAASWLKLVQTFQEHDLPSPRVRVETSSQQIRHPILAASNQLGYSSRPVVRQAAPHHRLVELAVPELKYIRHNGIIYREESYLSPAARRFIEILKTAGRRSPAKNADSRVA